MMKYSSYSNGLKVGDLVYYEFNNSLQVLPYKNSNSKRLCIVLHREFLFKNETRWGERKFFKYKIINSNREIFELKTQNIRILKRTGALWE